MKRVGPVLFLHPSDEHYGADRILLDLFDALPDDVRERAQFWLPLDVPHGMAPLCELLEERGATVRHLDLPILRRAYRTPGELARLLARCGRLWSSLRRERPAVVYCTTSAAFLGAPVARLARVPHVLGHVQELWTKADSWALRWPARACERIVAISEPVRLALPRSLQQRVTVVPNATPEPERVVPLEGRTGPLGYLVASRWNTWKGHGTLLAAWDAAPGAGQLVVLGAAPAGGEGVDVPALVRDLDDPGTVTVVGEVPSIGDYVEQCDVMVVPSDQPEPFGLVAVEAMARARPVIGSEGGGLADVVDDGVTGWLYPPGDEQALAKILQSLDRAQVEEAGRRARLAYEERFTARRYAGAWWAAVGPRVSAVPDVAPGARTETADSSQRPGNVR
jgi:glycosyltransferase involved in cell wall biosynthesis